MRLDIETKDGVTRIHVGGRLDAETAAEFNRAVDAQLDKGVLRVVVNLAELEYLNSSGLSRFIHLAQQLKKRGGRLAVCALKGPAAEVFDAAQLETLIPQYATEAEALAAV